VTQGIVDVTDERWSASSGTLSGTSQLVANDPYQLRVAGLSDGGKKWNLVAANISPEDQAAGVTISPSPARASEAGWARIDLQSTTSRPVKWMLKFTTE
jgi:hypothetical protein